MKQLATEIYECAPTSRHSPKRNVKMTVLIRMCRFAGIIDTSHVDSTPVSLVCKG